MTPAEKLSLEKNNTIAVRPSKPPRTRKILLDSTASEFRNRLRLSQQDVADALSLCVPSVRSAEVGHELSLTTAIKIAQFYGVPVEQLWKLK